MGAEVNESEAARTVLSLSGRSARILSLFLSPLSEIWARSRRPWAQRL